MKHKKHFKRSFKPFCNLCGFITRNKRKWVLKNNRLHLCRYCREDFILQAKTPASHFTLLDSTARAERHHAVPQFHLKAVLEPMARKGTVSTIKKLRKPADEDVPLKKLIKPWESAVQVDNPQSTFLTPFNCSPYSRVQAQKP